MPVQLRELGLGALQLFLQRALLPGERLRLCPAGIALRGQPLDPLPPGVPRLHQAAQLLHAAFKRGGIHALAAGRPASRPAEPALRLRAGEQQPPQPQHLGCGSSAVPAVPRRGRLSPAGGTQAGPQGKLGCSQQAECGTGADRRRAGQP
ncbi:hypothetical protein D3C73_1163440 [compost metagenome]